MKHKAGTVGLVTGLLIILLFFCSTTYGDHSRAMVKAAEDNDLTRIRNLLKQGADINEKDSYGRTPLHAAAETSNLDVVKLLLIKGAHVNAKGLAETTPLMIACMQRDVPLAKLLLKNGADVHATNWFGYTPLMTFSLSDNLASKRRLRKKGAEAKRKSVTEEILSLTSLRSPRIEILNCF